jgi:hypothetical protein
MSEIQVNTISEYTSANGVTIDGVKLKDNAVETNTISEGTSGSGVTIDSVLVKDGVAHSGLVKLASSTASSSATLTFDNFVDTSTYSHYIVALDSILPATNNVNLRFTFRTGGASGADKTGSYARGYAYNYLETSANSASARNTYTDYAEIANNVGNAGGSQHALQAIGQFFPGNGTDSTGLLRIPMTHRQYSGSVVGYFQNAVTIENLFTCTGLKFYMSSGNIASGSIHIFGVKK